MFLSGCFIFERPGVATTISRDLFIGVFEQLPKVWLIEIVHLMLENSGGVAQVK